VSKKTVIAARIRSTWTPSIDGSGLTGLGLVIPDVDDDRLDRPPYPHNPT
jgi:hypothetical protein